jgi:hypothetical protein
LACSERILYFFPVAESGFQENVMMRLARTNVR